MERESATATARVEIGEEASSSVNGRPYRSGAVFCPSGAGAIDLLFTAAPSRDKIRGTATNAPDTPTFYGLYDSSGARVRAEAGEEKWISLPEELFRGGLAFKLCPVEAGTSTPKTYAAAVDFIVAMKT